ncbi:MAG: chloride channel protein [Pseudomonadota bacterium]
MEKNKYRLPEPLRDLFTAFQLRLSRADAVLELSLLGLLSGVVAGIVSILFRLIIESLQTGYLTGPPGSFETLDALWRFALPVIGGLLIGLMLHWVRAEHRSVGVVHVMERLQYQQGRMPLGNALVQFIGGLLALVTGHSVGREGPGVHLGVAASNLPAQALKLPNNSLRVLAACGTAAAIAASFNTPLAGVAFAMEVLMFEYTVAAFAPVLLAAVSATVLSQLVFGSDLAFSIPALSLGGLDELPYVLLMGLLIGLLAGGFIRLLRTSSQISAPLPFWLRGLLAGLLVGAVGFFLPAVMGIGYDTVNRLILGEVALWLMFALIGLKLVVSTVSVGLGIPGGLIGPALVVGAATGGAFAWLAHHWGLMEASSTAFYVLLGMGAMMAGTLQAPLAGLIAILELTGNPNVIFPGMLAVIAATLTSGQVHGRESMYLAMLRATGRDYRNDPIAQSLRGLGVASAMERSFVQLPRRTDRTTLAEALSESPRWILLREESETPQLIAAVDIAAAVKEYHAEGTELDLMQLPATRYQAAPIDFQSTLQSAREQLAESGAEALYVTRLTVPGMARVFGILTREGIESSYRL